MIGLEGKLDEVFSNQVDPSWLLFQHVRPIVAEFMRSGRRISIESVFETKKERGEREAEIAEEIEEHIKQGLTHLYAAQLAFESEMKKARDPPHTDIHTYTTYGQFHKGFREHAQKFMKVPQGVTPAMRAATEKIIAFDPTSNGVDLNRRIYLSMKHGAHGIPHEERYSVVLQVSRIKDQRRVAQKFARYICKGVMEYEKLSASIKEATKEAKQESDISRNIKRLRISEKVKENLSAMHYYEFGTPFADPNTGLYVPFPDPLEYLALRARVSDGLGVICVARTREEAKALMGRLVQGKFQMAERYKVLYGKSLKPNSRNELEFEDAFIIDDHYQTDQKYLANGNQNMFTYLLPRRPHPQLHFRVDFGVYGWEDYCHDAVGGEGSHLLYEQKQEKEVQEWRTTRPELFELYQRIEQAADAILKRVDISSLEVYPEERKRREALLAK